MELEISRTLSAEGAVFIANIAALAALICGYFDWNLTNKSGQWWKQRFDSFQSKTHEDIYSKWTDGFTGAADRVPDLHLMSPLAVRELRNEFPTVSDHESTFTGDWRKIARRHNLREDFDHLKTISNSLEALETANSTWSNYKDERRSVSFLRPFLLLLFSISIQTIVSFPETFWTVERAPEVSLRAAPAESSQSLGL